MIYIVNIKIKDLKQFVREMQQDAGMQAPYNKCCHTCCWPHLVLLILRISCFLRHALHLRSLGAPLRQSPTGLKGMQYSTNATSCLLALHRTLLGHDVSPCISAFFVINPVFGLEPCECAESNPRQWLATHCWKLATKSPTKKPDVHGSAK